MRNKFPSRPVLIIDDEEQFLYSISLSLKANGITNVTTCMTGKKAKEHISGMSFSVIVLDVNLPDIYGPQLLDEIMELCPETPVVMVTAVDKAEIAVECMKKGALDYLVKPFDTDKMLAILRNAISNRELRGENEALKGYLLGNELKRPDVFSKIVTEDNRMRSLFLYAEAIATTPFPVLITGETGVGKELFAQAIHDLSGRKGPFVPVNVGGIDENAFSDTLFGHVKGAFTGADSSRPGLIERAAGGTLFLDEIGEIRKESQIKLLRVLQNRDYLPLGSDVAKLADIRLIVATNKTVDQLKNSSEFRSDLFHRLRTHHIALPPLRERRGDIPLLVEHFLDEVSKILGKKKKLIPRDVLNLFRNYSFPGNVRELRAMIFDVVSLQESGQLSVQLIKERLGISDDAFVQQEDVSDSGSKNLYFGSNLPTIQEAVQALINEALNRSDGNQNAAARLLGISPQALSRRLKYQTKKRSIE
jgi:DNA-binding NtrC family response regulator